MGNVRYKDIPSSLAHITAPKTEGYDSRVSVGIDSNIGEFYFIPIADLKPFRNQARKHFDEVELQALARSVKEHGVRQPLTVIACEGEKGLYEVISGERRMRAAQIAGLEKIPCILLKNKALAEEIAIVENIHRQDLHPIELGEAFQKLLTTGVFKTQNEIAEKFSLSRSQVSEMIGYTTLSAEVKEHLIKNAITSRDQIRQISKLENDSADEKVRGRELLEVNLAPDKTRGFSVIRAAVVDSQLRLQTKGLSKLSDEQRMLLKESLQKIIEQL